MYSNIRLDFREAVPLSVLFALLLFFFLLFFFFSFTNVVKYTHLLFNILFCFNRFIIYNHDAGSVHTGGGSSSQFI